MGEEDISKARNLSFHAACQSVKQENVFYYLLTCRRT